MQEDIERRSARPPIEGSKILAEFVPRRMAKHCDWLSHANSGDTADVKPLRQCATSKSETNDPLILHWTRDRAPNDPTTRQAWIHFWTYRPVSQVSHGKCSTQSRPG